MKSACVLLSAALSLPLAAQQRQLLDEVVARVNNHIITLSDLQGANQALQAELAQQHSGTELNTVFGEQSRDTLRNLIDRALLVQYGTERGYSVEADVIRELDRIRQRNNLESMEALERAMAAQGINIEDVKQQIRDQLMSDLVIQRDVARSVFLNDTEVQKYYEEHKEELTQPARVRLREILVSTGTRTESQAAERTQEVLAKIREGTAFEDIAKEYSDAPTAEKGGDLGYFEPKELSSEIQGMIQNLREGGVADPKLTPEGYIVLQLAERIEEGVLPLDKARPQVSQALYMEQVQPAFRKFLDRLRKENYVYVKPGYADTGAVAEGEAPAAEEADPATGGTSRPSVPPTSAPAGPVKP